MLLSLLKHYLDTETALKVSQSVYCFTTSISRGVENYFPRLWGTGISDAIFTLVREWFPFCYGIKMQFVGVSFYYFQCVIFWNTFPLQTKQQIQPTKMKTGKLSLNSVTR